MSDQGLASLRLFQGAETGLIQEAACIREELAALMDRYDYCITTATAIAMAPQETDPG
jgi:hypothetical protein